MNIAVIGLGLIGGSMAKSIKTRTSHMVFGSDINPETMTLARLSGAIDAPLTQETLAVCDLILLAVRPGAAINWLQEHAAEISKSSIVIDLCGVKRRVCAELSKLAEENGFSYIGGHPMAGKERGGFVNSSNDLFTGASLILTPDEHTDMHMLEVLKNFFLDLGFSTLTFTTPDEHDRIIAYTSQLSHISSSAYIKSPEAQRQRGFSAGSFQDMTRVARLDADMWTELLMANQDYLTRQLGLFIDHLIEYQTALTTGDADTLRTLLQDGCDRKAAAGGS